MKKRLIIMTSILLFTGMASISCAGLADWMGENKEVIGDKAMKDIVIPGTHDSITSSITYKSTFAKENVPQQLNWLRYAGGIGFIVTKIAADWSKAQGKTVTQQLEDGIRYLDLRVVYRKSDGKFYTCHGLYGDELSQVLNDINAFLDKHPTEVVILDFNHLYNMQPTDKPDQNLALVTLISDTFGEKKAHKNIYTNGIANATYGDLAKNKHQVIALYYNDLGEGVIDSSISEEQAFLWPGSDINSKWFDKAKLDELKMEMDKYLNSEQDRKMRADKFFVLQAILTPNGNTIMGAGLPNAPKSLKDLAMGPKSQMIKWLAEWKAQGQKLNIIIMDFLDDSEVIQAIVDMNK